MAKKIVDETLKFNILVNGTAAKKEYGQLERSNRKLLNANKDLEDQAKKMENANKQNSEAYKKLKQDLDKNATAVKNNEKRMSELSNEIGVNNLTMRELRQEARKLGGILSNLDPNTEDWKKYNVQLQSVKGRMSNLREEMKPIEESMDDQIDLASSLGVAFAGLWTSLAAGDIKGAQASLAVIQNGLKGATAAAWSFIATPVGAALIAISAAAAGLKFWANYNENLVEATRLTQQITGLMGEESDAVRRQAQVMEDTYGADFKETLGVANGLVKEFGITFPEALASIEKGLIKGQINNNEYLDSFKEYDTFFAGAGFAVEDFRKIIETGYDLGVYSDKLPDAIKEFDLAIKEQTKTTVDALTNAFGQSFSDNLLKRVKEGKITTKEALQEISAEAHKNGINIQQNAQLTADLFKGAGEDAGGATKIFEAYNIALNDQERALTPLENMIRDVAEANKDLAKAQDAALKSDNYVTLSNDIQLFWVKTKTVFFQGVKFITDVFQNSLERNVKGFVQFFAIVKAYPTIVKDSFKKVKKEVYDVVKTFGGLGDVMKNLMSFNFEAAADSFTKFKDNFKKEVGDVVDTQKEAFDKVMAIRKSVGDKVDKQFADRKSGAAALSGQNASSTNTSTTTTNPNNGNGSGDSSKKAELSDEDKAKIASKKKLNETLSAMEEERKIIEAANKFDEKAREEEEEVIRLENKFLKLQEEAAGETELLTRLEDEKLLQIQEVRDFYSAERLAKEEEEKDELEKIQIESNKRLQESEKTLQNAKNDAMASGLASLQSLVGKETALGKALFLIQKGIAISSVVTKAAQATATITASTAAANAIATAASPLTGGLPFTAINTASGASNILATKIAAGASIAAIAAETVTGFEEGLYPVKRKQDGKKYNASFGGSASTQIVGAPTTFLAGEMPEMIIDPNTFKQMNPAVTNYILGLAGKSQVGYEEGLYPERAGNDQNSEVMSMLASTILSLNERLEQPLKAETYYGAEASRRQQEYDKKIKQTRTNAKIKK